MKQGTTTNCIDVDFSFTIVKCIIFLSRTFDQDLGYILDAKREPWSFFQAMSLMWKESSEVVANFHPGRRKRELSFSCRKENWMQKDNFGAFSNLCPECWKRSLDILLNSTLDAEKENSRAFVKLYPGRRKRELWIFC